MFVPTVNGYHSKTRLVVLLALAIMLPITLTGCWASEDRLEILESRVDRLASVQGEQAALHKTSQATTLQNISKLNARVEALEGQLAEYRDTIDSLSESQDSFAGRVASLEGKLDQNALTRILASPSRFYIACIIVLLVGILTGVWVRRFSS